MRINNVNLERLQDSIEIARADPTKAKRNIRVEGRWNLAEGQPQFVGLLDYQAGKLALEADQASGLGGNGMTPSPLHYCIFGLAACYTATFATFAAMQKVRLRRLDAVAEGKFDLSRVLGISDTPALEEVQITLTVEADADQAKLDEIEQLARERCPAVYVLGNKVPLHTEMKVLAAAGR